MSVRILRLLALPWRVIIDPETRSLYNKADEEHDLEEDESGTQQKGVDYASYYQGLWDCHGDQSDELSFQRGDLIRILSKEYSMYGWWVGELNSLIGIVPKEYLTTAFEVEER